MDLDKLNKNKVDLKNTFQKIRGGEYSHQVYNYGIYYSKSYDDWFTLNFNKYQNHYLLEHILPIFRKDEISIKTIDIRHIKLSNPIVYKKAFINKNFLISP